MPKGDMEYGKYDEYDADRCPCTDTAINRGQTLLYRRGSTTDSQREPSDGVSASETEGIPLVSDWRREVPYFQKQF